MIDREAGVLANFGGTKEMYLPVRGNTYPIKDQIKAIGGRWDATNKVWMIPEFRADYVEGLMKSKGLDTPAQEPVREANLDVSGILKLFAGSKRPIKLQASDGTGIRLSVAKERAKEPGSVIVTTDAAYEDRIYIGRIALNGTYFGAQRYAAQKPVVELLKALSADPAAVAKAYGDKTHHCCFCSIRLTDPRSKSAGYGPVCADNRGLPWGDITCAEAEDALERGNDACDDPGNAAEAAMVREEMDACERDVFEKEGEITARVGAYNPMVMS